MTPYSCCDRMCGADDCINCRPENFNIQHFPEAHLDIDEPEYDRSDPERDWKGMDE